MPDFPPEILEAATKVLHDENCDDGDTRTCGRWNSKVPGGYDPQRHIGYYEDRAREVLDAVAAPLGDYAAAKILAHMEAHVANPATTKFPRAQATRQHSARRHFQTAARVAAGAFLTEDDTLRLAAEAITRGDYAVCPALEDEK